MLARSCAVAILATLLPLAEAQHYGFHAFGREAGLLTLEVQCLYQDRAGFLWVGTRNGLYRYEGAHFTYFDKAKGLPHGSIQSIRETADGTLWVGTLEGLARFNGTSFNRVPLDWNYKMYGQHSLDSSANSLYFTTDRGLVRGELSSRHWTFTRIMSREESASKPSSGVYAASDGRVWFGCARNLCVYDGSEVAVLGSAQGLPDRQVWSWIGVTPQGEFAARSTDHLIVFDKIPPKPALPSHPRDEPVAPAAYNAGSPAFDDQGRMLVPTLDGLAIRQSDASWKYVTSSQGLLDDNISCVLEDREGSLWIGLTSFGLVRWPGYGVWETWGRAEGLSSESIWTLKYDANGTLWAATSRGINRFVNGKWEALSKAAMPLSQQLMLAFGPNDTVWAGSYPHGLFEIDARSGIVRKQYGEAEFGTPWIFGVATDPSGRLWVSTFRGLFRSASSGGKTHFERQEPPKTNPKESFRQALFDRRGRLWVGGDYGLAMYDRGTWRRYTALDGLKDARPGILAEGPDGAIYMSQFGSPGISRIDEAGGAIKVTHLDLKDGPDSRLIFSLGFDRSGALWTGTDMGVDVKRPDGWHRYGEQDGLAWNDTNGDSLVAGHGDDVWIGTGRGLSHYLGRETGRESTPPDVVITSASFGNGTAVTTSNPDIPYRDRALHIAFAALTFRDEEGVRFRYRFSGGKWVTTANRELHVPELSPGRYEFEVMARSSRGVRSRNTAVFRFRILPPWYLEWWVLAADLAFVCLSIWAVYRWRVRRLVRRQNRLEAMVSERTRELEVAKEKAEESSRLKSEFLATMSHEIRTPMNAVIGITNLMLASETGSDERGNLEIVKNAGESLMVLLNDMLDLSRIEAGRLPFENSPFSVRDCVSLARRTVEVEANNKGLELTCSIASAVPDALMGDAARLRQVLINLLGNAIKFTAAGSSASTSRAARKATTTP